MYSMPRLRSGILVTFLCFAVAGCSGDARAKVKGRVKYVDKYLTAGKVGFIGEKGLIGVATISPEGNYEMNDAPVGPVKITVQVPNIPAGGGPKPPPGVPAPQGGAAVKVIPIPPKYATPETSKQTYTVQKGEQTYDIPLPP